MGAFGRQEPLLDQKRDDPCAEEFFQRREAFFSGRRLEAIGRRKVAKMQRVVRWLSSSCRLRSPASRLIMAMTTPVVPSGRPSVVRWNSARHRWAMRQSSLMSPRWNRKYGRSILGIVNVKCRCGTGARTVSASSAPKSCTFFWWHDGQNHRPLHENGSKY
jgi:hypothetical protein